MLSSRHFFTWISTYFFITYLSHTCVYLVYLLLRTVIFRQPKHWLPGFRGSEEWQLCYSQQSQFEASLVLKNFSSCIQECQQVKIQKACLNVELLWDYWPEEMTMKHYTWTFVCEKVKSEVAQSCPTLCDPMDCSPPGSSARGIFQARGLEWGAIAFSFVSLEGVSWR